jgi:hypothetical protein
MNQIFKILGGGLNGEPRFFFPSSACGKQFIPSRTHTNELTLFPKMSDDKLNPSETAIILIEFQNDFTSDGGKQYSICPPHIYKGCLLLL